MKNKLLTLSAILTSSSLLLTPCCTYAADFSPNDTAIVEYAEQPVEEDTLPTDNSSSLMENISSYSTEIIGNDLASMNQSSSSEISAFSDDFSNDLISINGLFGTKYVVTGDNVNIGTGPGTSYTSVGKLYKGDIITVKSIDNGWAKFKYNGQWRYVSATYLKTK